MKYDITQDNLLQRYPELIDVFVLKRNYPPPVELIKYILLVYSKDSDLMRENWEKRKQKAANLAGYKRDAKGNLDQKTQDILLLEDDRAFELIMRFVKFQNEMTWALLVASQENYWENHRLLSEPLKSGTELKDKDILGAANLKSVLRKQNKDIIKEIDDYSVQLFGDLEKEKEKLKRITPERVNI